MPLILTFMLVKQIAEGWEITFQRSHGVLAAQIGFYWQKKQRPVRWIETLLAIAGHDDAQQDFSGKTHITPAGTPLNFNMQDFYLHQPEFNTKYAFQKSHWIGLLTSLHMTFLWEEKRGHDKKLDAMLDEQQALQKQACKTLGITTAEAARHYRLLEWCDALSLLLCRDLIQPEERKIDISTAPDGTVHQLWQRKKDNSLTVVPWCFDDDEFEVSVETRQVKQATFKDDAELEKALQQAPILEKKWTFKK